MGKVFEYAQEFAEESGKDIDSFETAVAFSRHIAQRSKELERLPKRIRRMTLEDFHKRQRRKQSHST
ncbi:MAG: hypothetical protein H8D23_11675 [Candidatus Brocadiales bacterium]|nr:hypothetical protein [Candidatus Brocadiales bacterium]